ncbi:CRISPR-associated protein Cas4/endonuclease Cas1 fusion [Posidoniimonas corsicana]|uniref:CRISPR-associated endonuclease Cas1 n=1 Tax=Posidoniimonas corsicana TaxID=1938618 RepID=A0A5C5VD29_9BACT|nr:type I-C CRISPR-associated endonuclease Cas1c [Posidoniimonas corsicana]TWT35612.1 CRISPR-associated protein Cas4/endonuclease Cas1 fusion [Posidoniimonas corsicana]
MKTHLNTLFITTQGAYLAKDGQAVAVRIEKKTRLRVPLHNLDAITCFGRVGLSPQLMAACAEAGVSLSLLSESGRFRAAVVGYSPGNVLLRRQQYRAADDEKATCEAARSFVLGKLGNCRTVLNRAARDDATGERADRLSRSAKRMGASIVEAKAADSTDRLRGIEGEAALQYFATFDTLRTSGGGDFAFRGRSRRPPLDRINALLSFVYTLLMSDVRSACESVGLDAAVGFLHRDRPGRPGLALDLMEEFRPWLADRFVLTLINRGQVRPNDFQTVESGAVLMKEKARKDLLVAWQNRKQEETTHTFLGERCTIGLVIHLQARLFARYLRGDIDAYPPYLWK